MGMIAEALECIRSKNPKRLREALLFKKKKKETSSSHSRRTDNFNNKGGILQGVG